MSMLQCRWPGISRIPRAYGASGALEFLGQNVRSTGLQELVRLQSAVACFVCFLCCSLSSDLRRKSLQRHPNMEASQKQLISVVRSSGQNK